MEGCVWCGESQPLWRLFPFPRGVKSQDRASMGNSLDIFGEVCVLLGCCAWCFLLLYFFLYCDTLPLLPFVLFYLIASQFLLVLSFFFISSPPQVSLKTDSEYNTLVQQGSGTNRAYLRVFCYSQVYSGPHNCLIYPWLPPSSQAAISFLKPHSVICLQASFTAEQAYAL